MDVALDENYHLCRKYVGVHWPSGSTFHLSPNFNQFPFENAYRYYILLWALIYSQLLLYCLQLFWQLLIRTLQQSIFFGSNQEICKCMIQMPKGRKINKRRDFLVPHHIWYQFCKLVTYKIILFLIYLKYKCRGLWAYAFKHLIESSFTYYIVPELLNMWCKMENQSMIWIPM